MEMQLGNYQLLEQFGAGGLGVVYRALDTRLNRDVAINVLPAGFAQNWAALPKQCGVVRQADAV